MTSEAEILLLLMEQVSSGAPAIAVTGNGQSISDGSITPSEDNFTHFFVAMVGDTFTRQFNIANAGGAALTGVSVVAPTGFSVSVAPSATINAGANSNFTIACDTGAAEIASGVVTISSNELPDFTFTIKAYVFPVMAVVLWHASDFWQDSAGTTPADEDGDVVGRWDDWTANGRDITQATTADKPLLDTTGGLRSVEFDGISDYLSRNESLIANTDNTIIVAFSSTTSTLTQALFSEASVSSVTPQNIVRFNNTSAGRVGATWRDDAVNLLTQTSAASVGANDGNAHILIARRNGTNRNLRFDGVQADDDTYTQGTTTTTRWGAGAYLPNVIAQFANAKIFAILIATASISDAARTVVEAGLAEFYQ